jgi:hypothetical protein
VNQRDLAVQSGFPTQNTSVLKQNTTALKQNTTALKQNTTALE